MRRLLASPFGVLLLALPAGGWASTWEIDPVHTQVQFAVRHLMVSTVRGDFGKVNGTVNFDEKTPTNSTVEATIDTASINTRVAKRDNDLKSAEFLDVGKYPTMTFRSKKIEQVGDGKFKITGDLTLHGVTKEVVLDLESAATPFKDPFGKMRVGGTATTKISRKDFGITWNKALETGGVVVGDEVAVTIDTELTQKQTAAEAAPDAAANAAAEAVSGMTKKAVGAGVGR